MAELKLPLRLASKHDLIGLQREVDQLLNEQLQARVSAASAGVQRKTSNPSAILGELLHLNNLQHNEADLGRIKQDLADLREHAPVVRLSFASEPSHEVLVKLAEWFRRQVDPQLFLQIGVQPSIAGGVVVHTDKRRYDLSLRQQLLSKNELFIKAQSVLCHPAAHR